MSRSACDYEYKKRVIDAVQIRIDKWLPRPYTIIEALDLKKLEYPFMFKVMPIVVFYHFFEQDEIKYDRLMRLSYSGYFKDDVERLWEYTTHNYLSHVFGG